MQEQVRGRPGPGSAKIVYRGVRLGGTRGFPVLRPSKRAAFHTSIRLYGKRDVIPGALTHWLLAALLL